MRTMQHKETKVSLSAFHAEERLRANGTVLEYKGTIILCARNGQYIIRWGQSHKSFHTLEDAQAFLDEDKMQDKKTWW